MPQVHEADTYFGHSHTLFVAQNYADSMSEASRPVRDVLSCKRVCKALDSSRPPLSHRIQR